MGEGGADIGGGAVAVVGQALDVHGNTGRAVALVHDVLVHGGVGAGTEGLVDGGLDLVLGHGLSLGLGHGSGEGGVVVRVGVVAKTGRDGDVTAQLGEQGGTLSVLRTLAVLGSCPFRVSGHMMLLLFSRPRCWREPI